MPSDKDYALQGTNNTLITSYTPQTFTDVIVEASVQSTHVTAELHVRQRDVSSYSLHLAPDGQHLHIAVFYAQEDPSRPIPTRRIADGFDNYHYDWFFTTYDLGANGGHTERYGFNYLVNPLVLWPSAQDGTSCRYWKILQNDEGRTN